MITQLNMIDINDVTASQSINKRTSLLLFVGFCVFSASAVGVFMISGVKRWCLRTASVFQYETTTLNIIFMKMYYLLIAF
jgi:hypothetical protein